MKLFQRLWDSVGFSDRYDEEYDYDYEEADLPPEVLGEGPPPERKAAPGNGAGSNVIGLPGRNATSVEMLLMEPRTFEEIPQAVAALRERKSVVLNLGFMDPDMAQRSVDFVAGGSFAIDGHQERLGENIFLFTPSFVQIRSYPGAVQQPPLQPPVTAVPPVIPARPVAPPPGWANYPFQVNQ